MADASKKIPRNATHLRLGAVTFAQVGDAPADGKGPVPVKMVARTGQPIDHWYWGKLAHDLEGMKVHKDRLPIDYAHFDEEVIGYLDTFDAASGDLVVSGAMVPFTAEDRASEVIFKQKAGVPYEASINWGGDGIVVEEVGPNATAKVNGYDFTGPGVIVRQWPLRGVAVCPYGADANTTTEFKGGGETVAVTYTKGTAMAAATADDEKDPKDKPAKGKLAKDKPVKDEPAGDKPAGDKPAEKPEDEKKPAAAGDAGKGDEDDEDDETDTAGPAATKHAQRLTKFITAFGDVGGRWFAEGRKFSACVGQYAADLGERHKTELAAKDAEIARLKAVVDATPRGDKGVTFSAADGGAGTPNPFAKNLPAGIATFAAALKMPGTPAAAAAK
ncbi:MAG: hypothetical protein JWO31_896 [Phycisphaerales bacterium]|nr:hypothetical protein [Phycisphaerales bacterium]